MDIKNILSLIDNYISKYKNEKNPKYETIYRLTSSEVASMDTSFIRDDKSRVYFCFYRLPSEEYDKEDAAQEFASAFFMSGNDLKDDKIKLEMNVVMPVRVDGDNVYVDRAMMAEIISHELMHAYRKHKEIQAGHYKWTSPAIDFFKRRFSNQKYTTVQRYNAYIRTTPGYTKENKMVRKMQWVGYTFVEDEMFANLAGIKTYLAAGGELNKSRAVMLVNEMKNYLEDIEQNATEEDWLRCMKKTSYISARKDENVNHFRHRWLSYYKDRLLRFEKAVEKIKKNKTVDKFKTGQGKILSNVNKEILKNSVYERD